MRKKSLNLLLLNYPLFKLSFSVASLKLTHNDFEFRYSKMQASSNMVPIILFI